MTDAQISLADLAAEVGVTTVVAAATLLCLYTALRHRRPQSAFTLPLFSPAALEFVAEDGLLDVDELAASIGPDSASEPRTEPLPTVLEMQQTIEQHLCASSAAAEEEEVAAIPPPRNVTQSVDASDELRAAINDLRRALG